MSVNSTGYIHLGGDIRNIYILLLLSLSFGIVTDIDGNEGLYCLGAGSE